LCKLTAEVDWHTILFKEQQDFTVLGDRFLHLFELKDIRWAIFGVYNCFHRVLLFITFSGAVAGWWNLAASRQLLNVNRRVPPLWRQLVHPPHRIPKQGST
jgi:hypothetical protein